MGKPFLVVIGVLAVCILVMGVILSAVTHERDILLLEIERMNTELALSSQSLMQSNEAIARQNAEIKKLNSALASSENQFNKKLSQLESKYVSMVDKSKQSLAKNNDCENMLALIRESQRGFLNE